MASYLHQLKEEIFPHLQCPACKNGELSFKEGSFPIQVNFECHNEYLKCIHCEEIYPITKDFIPVMWDSSIKDYLTNKNIEGSSLTANIDFYDEFSGDYYKCSRVISDVEIRLQAAVKTLFDDKSNLDVKHLDWGCGPGQVLKWLAKFRFNQFGLDVSLTNLRNTRKNTGAKVVCGSAVNMPFKSNIFDLVTESSVLHHIENWQDSIRETCRVCAKTGKIIVDSEPSKEQMAWSKLAIFIFDLRFPIYKLLSYFMKSKYAYRDISKAKLQVKAEVHHQPRTGICMQTLPAIINEYGYKSKVIYSPTPTLASIARPGWKSILLNILSLRNPFNPKYGLTIILGY